MLTPKPVSVDADPEKERRRREYEYLQLKAKAAASGQPSQPAPQAAPRAQAPQAQHMDPWSDGQDFENIYRKTPEQVANAPNPIDTAWRASMAQVNNNFAESRRQPTPEELATQAEAERRANSEALYRAVGEGGIGAGAAGIAPTQTFDAEGNTVSQGDVNRILPARFGASAANTIPGTANFILEAADAAFGPGPRFDFMGNPLEFSNTTPLRPEDRIMTGGVEAGAYRSPKPLELLPTVPLDPARDGAEMTADLGGTLAGYMVGPGGGISSTAKATGAAVRGVGPVGKAAAAITPQGTSLAAKAGRYGGRMAATLPENAAHAAMFGGIVGQDGSRVQTAGEFAADPINYLAQPVASLLYRGGLALNNMARGAGASVTPEAIRLQRAMQTLQGGDATPAQMQAAAQTIDEVAPPLPEGQAPPASQAAPQAPPTAPGAVPQRPPVGATQTATQVATPPAPPPPSAPVGGAVGAASAPPPGTLTPVVPGQGVAVDSFNALPVKTREGMLRALSASGMSRDQAFAAIRSLNDLPPERANMFEAELIRRYGGPDQFPNLKTNLTAMGSDFSMQVPAKGGDPQGVMNRSLLEQAKSEGEYLERMAEEIFGPGKVATKADLEQYREVLGGRYRKVLSEQYPGTGRMRGANKVAEQQRIDAARGQLAEYLKRPDVMENVPAWVQDEVMLQVSADLRRLQFNPDERAIILQGNPELAPLFTPDRELIYSPRLWQTLVDLYPTQVAHSLQSAYRSAIDTALRGTDAAQRTVAKRLMRMRGQSRVRANAANPDKRGFGLLYLLEDAAPGYKELRQEFGDVAGAQAAADMPNSFFRVAGDEEALADFITVFDEELTPLQQEAVRNGITTQIRQALRNKTDFTDLTELDQAARLGLPNLTKITSRPFLEALPKVFGADGERMVDAIRLSRANVDNIASINKSFASGTPKGMEIRQNARNIYENPSATDANPIDAATSTLAGVGGFAAVNGSLQVAVPVLGGAALRGLYRWYKRGKSLTPGQREALAEWLFKPRRATDARPPTTPKRFSRAGYAGNVATGAAIGAAAGATQGDPNAVAMGAVAGALGGATRAGLRAARAERSIIKPPPAPRGPRRGPPPATGNSLNTPPAPRQLPGQTSPAAATVTGGVGGAFAGAALNPDDPEGGAAAGLLAGLGVGAGVGLGKRLSKMGGSKPKTVKPPPRAGGKPPPVGAKAALDPDLPPPPKERFLVGSDGSRKSLGMAGEEQTVKFTAPSGKRFQIEFRRDGDAMAVDFREVGAKAGYKPTGTGSAAEANAILDAVQKAIRDDVAKVARPRYMFVGETAQQSRIYQQMARTTEPPKGYRWEGPDSNGAVHLQRADLAPPTSGGSTPPPVQAGIGGKSQLPMDEASRMQRAREMGFDVDTPLYHGTASDFQAFDPSKRGINDGFAPDAQEAFFFSTNPRIANQYAEEAGGVSARRKAYGTPEGKQQLATPTVGGARQIGDMIDDELPNGQNVIPAYARLKNPLIVTDLKAYDGRRVRNILAQAKENGHDGVIFRGMTDALRPGAGPADTYAIFNPANIRGKFAKFDPSQEGSSKLLSAFPGGTAAQVGAGVGGAAYGAANAQDLNGDGEIDGEELTLSMMAPGFLGLTAAGVTRNALSRGPRGVKPPPKARVDVPKAANDGLPKGQQTPAEDLAMARAFTREPLTVDRAQDFIALLRGEQDLRQVMDILDIRLSPTIVNLPRGRAMIERTRDEVLKRSKAFLAASSSKPSPISSAFGAKPPPASNAFGGGKGKPKPEPRPVLGGRVIKQVQQAAKSLPPEVRNRLSANAQLPAGARKSAVEAAGDDPSIYRMAAPFQNAKPGPIMRQAERVPTITGKSAFPRPANPIDEGVNASLDRIERNVGPPRSLDPIAEAAGIAERRRRAAVAEASRWNAKVNTQTREAQGLPDMPVPKALARNEQEATELAIAAKRALAAANLETTSAQEARAWAEQRKEAIIQALLGQSDGAKPVGVMATRMQVGGASSKTPPVRPPKPVSYQDARDMAELLFDADNAKMLDDVLSGRVKPKNRDDHHMALLMLGGATGLGITGLAIANDAPERTPPKDNYDPQQYMNPGDPRYVWDWDKMKTNRQAVQAIQVNLNALPPNADGARYNLSVDAWGKKTEAALKHWQYENGFNPDGAMTAEQWELLNSQALAARRNEPARMEQRR